MDAYKAVTALRRYGRHTWRPFAALSGALIVASLARSLRRFLLDAGHHAMATAVYAGVGLVIAGCALSLLLGVGRALREPRRDQQAAEHLAWLRAVAREPNHILLEIRHVQWRSRAGQRVWAVDTTTGEIRDCWLAGTPALPVGALILVRRSLGHAGGLVDWLPPERLTAACRHENSNSARHGRRTAPIPRRSRRAAARAVVREAERLLIESV